MTVALQSGNGRGWKGRSAAWAWLRWRINRLAAGRVRPIGPTGAPEVRRAPAAFIVGVPRSGTTLLRMMLDAHPDVAVPPETGFITGSLSALARQPARFLDCLVRTPSWADFHLDGQALAASLDEINPFSVTEGLRCFYASYAARLGKSRFGDKTPGYLDRMPLIAALLPEARFVHIIRDGRDVALSWQKAWFAPSQDLAVLARLWGQGVRMAHADATRLPHYLEVRFEALVEQPERELPRLCAFLDLPFSDSMLRYYEGADRRLDELEPRYGRDGALLIDKAGRQRRKARARERLDVSRVGAWRVDMTGAERFRVEAVAGPLLSRLGYL